ncbi:MAG: LysR family transcriptional regulator [Chloroflexi bacterium]|nr:LysR family transcriptional regulator [Chloroflexota bacterium]
MTFTQLRYFCALVRNGNYSGAAEECFVSEPVIHRVVRTLERDCGIELLQRKAKGFSLTDAGRSIYQYGQQMASVMDAAEQSLLEKKRALHGDISIGGGSTILTRVIRNVLAPWMSEHDHIHVSIVEGRVSYMTRLLLDNRLDLIFGSGSVWADELRSEPIFTDTLVVIANPSHPFTKLHPVPIREFARQKLILVSPGSRTRNLVDDIGAEFGALLKSRIDVERQGTAALLCETGLGLAIVPKSLIVQRVENGRLSMLDVEGFPRSRPYFVVYRRDKVLTPEMQSLLTAIRKWAQDRGASKTTPAGNGQFES